MTTPERGTEVEVSADPRRRAQARPWVMANMITSLDGSCVVSGRAHALGGGADRRRFRSIRSLADVVLVGATTARTERYDLPAQRQPPLPAPRLAVVSGSARFSSDQPFVMRGRGLPPEHRALLLTTRLGAVQAHKDLGSACAVVVASDTNITPEAIISALASQAAGVIVCEGGPHLLGQLLLAGLVDEWFVTISPTAVAGDGVRMTMAATEAVTALSLLGVVEADGFLLLRYLTRR